ncbi:MAG: DUF859 domain-containing protein [Ruminococcus flavefaciens]|nr:DUF859 domain-containing protein [Ruminococcus flavefaciens]
MASSGSFSGSIVSGHYKLRVDWNQTKNVTANTSTIACHMYLVNDYSLSISGRSSNICTINGVQSTFSSPAISTTGTHSLGSVSQAVAHNSDGSKSLTISAIFYIRATISGVYYDSITASATITLDSIPRASSVSAVSINIGTATRIDITRASSAFTHTITYKFGSASGTIASQSSLTTLWWTPPLTLASQIPNATTGICTITCTTYSGSTNIGSKTCTMTLTVPASIKPTIASLTAERIDGTVPSSWGIYVQTKSKAILTINGAAGNYGSTISSYSITGGGFTGAASSLTTGYLNNYGEITFTATVTDSRGRVSDAVTVTISVVRYFAPYFERFSSQRCTSAGALSDEGTYVLGNALYNRAACNDLNRVTRSIYYKKSSDTEWLNAGAIFSSGDPLVFGSGRFSTEFSYDIKYVIQDTFNTVAAIDFISTAAVIMDFKSGGKGLAIGKVSEDDGLDVKFASHFRSTVLFDDVVNIGSMLNVTNGATVWGLSLPGYGTCATAASTAIKVVSCAGFYLKAGAICTIQMTYANTHALPQLNINGTGAYYLSYQGVRAASGSTRWLAGSMLTVMFTGSYYEVLSIAGAWTPTIGGTSAYSFQDGYFQYNAGIVAIGFAVSGVFSSTTTTGTQTVISGLPFSYAGQGLASGGGIAYGCTSSSPGFFGWCIASGESTITARNCTLSGNTYGANYVYNAPGGHYNITGSITMRAI